MKKDEVVICEHEWKVVDPCPECGTDVLDMERQPEKDPGPIPPEPR